MKILCDMYDVFRRERVPIEFDNVTFAVEKITDPILAAKALAEERTLESVDNVNGKFVMLEWRLRTT